MRPAIIQLPRTGGRNSAPVFLKLLKRIAPRLIRSPWDFEGCLFKPGAYVPESALHPDPDYPDIPILLECAGTVGRSRGHVRAPTLYILWRYDRSAELGWHELGRAESESWHWALDLAPLAERAIAEARGSVHMEIMPALPVLIDRLAHLVDEELRRLEAGDRVKLLAALHDQVAARMVALYRCDSTSSP